MNSNDIQNIYEELLELEGLALLIRERLGNEPPQVLEYFADRLSRLNSRVMRLMDVDETLDPVECAIAESAEVEESEDADVGDDIVAETHMESDADAMESEAVYDPLSAVGDGYAAAAIRTDESRSPKSEPCDLRRSFTINDRFRFRRELFGNRDSDMTDTINMVSAMNSFAEAEEYFYEDLGWDKSADEVKDFMAIIERHFNGRII